MRNARFIASCHGNCQRGSIRREMFLTTFLWEEAKHTEFFRRFLDEVVQEQSDLHHYHTASFRTLFYETLPQTMHTLLAGSIPRSPGQGLNYLRSLLRVYWPKQDTMHTIICLIATISCQVSSTVLACSSEIESRHLAYGVFLISRLVAQDHSLWPIVEQHMNTLLIPALGVVNELFEGSEELEEQPFGQSI